MSKIESNSGSGIKRGLAEQELLAAVDSFDRVVRLVNQLREQGTLTEQEQLSVHSAGDKSSAGKQNGSPRMFRATAAAMLKTLLQIHPELAEQVSRFNAGRRR